jgi:hypothetical protein
MYRPLLLAVSTVAALALAGCASTGSSSAAAGQPSSSATSASAAPASQGPCTTKACIVSDAEQLKGTVAKDNSVATAVTCKTATVKRVVAQTYTVHCTMDYSDGAVWDGIASVLISQDKVAWEPTAMVSSGSGS